MEDDVKFTLSDPPPGFSVTTITGRSFMVIGPKDLNDTETPFKVIAEDRQPFIYEGKEVSAIIYYPATGEVHAARV
jgi:hypothetical protein